MSSIGGGDGIAGQEYLSNYGVKDARREKRFFRIAGSIAGAALLGTILWYYLRTYNEEQIAKQFFANLQARNYKAAYAQFGCTDASPCRDYSFDRFLEDWGEKSPYANTSTVDFSLVEPCGNTVWFTIKQPGTRPVGIAVDPESKLVTFTPSASCPGVWRVRDFPGKLMAYIKRRM